MQPACVTRQVSIDHPLQTSQVHNSLRCNLLVWQDRSQLTIPSNQPSSYRRIWGWMTRSWLHILAWRWICWYNAPDIGGNLFTPCALGRLLKPFHLRSEAVLAEAFLIPRRLHKNSSHPVFVWNNGSPPFLRLLKVSSTLGGVFKYTLNAVFLPAPFIWPVMWQPVWE